MDRRVTVTTLPRQHGASARADVQLACTVQRNEVPGTVAATHRCGSGHTAATFTLRHPGGVIGARGRAGRQRHQYLHVRQMASQLLLTLTLTLRGCYDVIAAWMLL